MRKAGSLSALKMDEGATSQGTTEPLKARKVKKQILPWSLQEEHNLADTLIFAQEDPPQISALQNRY